MDTQQIIAIRATLNKPVSYALMEASTDSDAVESASECILRALLPAFLTKAPVEIELVGGSAEIKRVHPYYIGAESFDRWMGDYQVVRIATQRMDDGRDEHLEAFVVKQGSTDEKSYNVYDRFHQQLLCAAFLQGRYSTVKVRVALEIEGDTIVTVQLGMK